MELIMSRIVVMLGLLMVAGVTADESKTAVKFVLGGSPRLPQEKPMAT